jgi:hypothetical protein
MKMTTPHYAHLCDTLDRAPRLDPDAYAAAGFTQKRYRWDALRNAGLVPWVCDTCYLYLNDSHIDTALREYFAHAK